MQKIHYFIIEKIRKYLKCPALCMTTRPPRYRGSCIAPKNVASRGGGGGGGGGTEEQSWALEYFLICSIIKNEFFAFFIKLITYFCTSPI